MTRAALTPDEYHAYYAGYVGRVPGEYHVATALDESLSALTDWLDGVTEPRGADYRYAAGKWTVAQALQHVIDAERVFAYRALCFARGDAGPLPGFEQDDFAAQSLRDGLRPLPQLVAELRGVRASTMALFAGLSPEALTRRGVMSGAEHSVRAVGFIIAGHALHHAALYRERYAGALA